MATSQMPSSTAATGDADRPILHCHGRWFIGPMPENAISTQNAPTRGKSKHGLYWWRKNDGDQSTQIAADHKQLPQAIKRRAFDIFLVSGGNEAEWGEETEGHIIEEMTRKWRSSEWGRILSGEEKKEKKVGNETWVGASFEIGDFLGVNLLRESESLEVRTRKSKRSRISGTSSSEPIAGSSFQTGGDTFVTAPLGPPLMPGSASDINGSIDGRSHPESVSALSTTGLLHPPIPQSMPSSARTEPTLRPVVKPSTPSAPVARSEGGIQSSLSQGKAIDKAKQVHYAEPLANDSPAPPHEVLERSGSAVDETSAGASVADMPSYADGDGEVVMEDRMLVRVSYTKADVAAPFNEAHNRTMTHLEHQAWSEFMTVWRRDTAGDHWIELQENYSTPGKEWLLRHKYLAFVVPLRPSACQLSVYSFIDLTFCVTCQPTSTAKTGGRVKHLMQRAKEGTNIFVFKLQSRTRASDWIWHLWLQLGGTIPSHLEVRNISTDTRINIDVPAHSPHTDWHESVELGRIFTVNNVRQLCIQLLRKIPDWRAIVDKDISDGLGLELAWRSETYLDWIWLEEDPDGSRRDWAVLTGLAFKQLGKPCHLELRKAEHAPSSVAEDGKLLVRPPSIEGYLDLIRPTSQVKQPIYLSSHENLLFILSRANAHPPSPPGIDLATGATKESEVKRGAQQILGAFGVTDLRNIVAVRQAFQHTPRFMTNPPAKKGRAKDVDEWAHAWATAREGQAGGDDVVAQNEVDDQGGDEGLANATDRTVVTTRRSFELLVASGNIFRFEAYSCQVALEWIDRLRALIRYWRQRHRVDAREEMDLAQFGSGRPRVTPRVHPYEDPNATLEPPVDPTANFPALGAMYNWCVIDGCTSTAKRGKLFMRRGMRGQYKLVDMLLTSGYLVQYHVAHKSPVNHRQSRLISLVDAYVCSGYLAALTLPTDQFDASATPVARRYQDGLEVDDSDEDTLFVILYRAKTPLHRISDDRASKPAQELGAKRKLAIFRTRSKLERDAWCWAIGCEIEKLVRNMEVSLDIL